ncbi:hypothetical protein B0H12DRAFT_322565 [Mycena haematopus]|nr:hypothetical protein B0H12DRAFT_322565 [Mycena haematopus]
MNDPRRKVSGTKRAAQSVSGRDYQPMPAGSPYSPAPSSSGGGLQPSSSNPSDHGPTPSGSGARYAPAPFQPSSFAGPMQPSNQRSYVPRSVLGPAHTKRTSYPYTQPLAPPQGRRARQLAKRPVREADSSPSSAKRIMASTISAPLPVKSAQPNLPHWQVNDSANARAAGSKRFAAMTVGGRSTSEYQAITTKFAYANQNVRREYESNAGQQYARKAARKRQEQEQVPEDDESTSESESESESDSDEEEVVPSESEPESEPDRSDPADSSDDDEVVIIEPPPKPPVIELLDDTPLISPVILPTPPEELIAAIERLTHSLTCMLRKDRLPFLKRNVRRGFLQYCQARGVQTRSQIPFQPTTVVFRLEGSEVPPHEASISCHECPLCELHLPFRTKEMLVKHLELDHGEVETIWHEIDQQNVRLVLVLPGQRDDALMSPTRPKSPSLRVERLHDNSVQPVPPPFGPTARYPFLPAKSEYGGPDVTRSVRFDGPKIYDLLNTLPMEPFGILGWAVLEKEEEIFESDDISDEHKVMHALWARWIHLNRNLFISDYFEGTKTFINEYWKMIRLAAGLNALRYWLVVSFELGSSLRVAIAEHSKMLVANRYLTGKHVALLLRHYESWCD